jgi:hypothetical protein
MRGRCDEIRRAGAGQCGRELLLHPRVNQCRAGKTNAVDQRRGGRRRNDSTEEALEAKTRTKEDERTVGARGWDHHPRWAWPGGAHGPALHRTRPNSLPLGGAEVGHAKISTGFAGNPRAGTPPALASTRLASHATLRELGCSRDLPLSPRSGPIPPSSFSPTPSQRATAKYPYESMASNCFRRRHGDQNSGK